MATALPDLTAKIRVDTSDLDRAGGRASGILGKIGGAAGAAAIAAGAAFAGFAAIGIKGASDVEAGLREVVTLLGETGGAADNSLKGFQKDTAALSNELGVAQETLTKGLYSAISAGVPKDNAFEFLRVASKAGIAGVADTETAVDGLTTTINAFGLDIGEAQAVADSMFAAVKGGKTTFGELSASMSNVAPAAAASGVSFQEVNAAIATLTASGVPTAQATTQLRAALVGLQKPSKEMDKIFQDLGYANAQTAIEAEGLGFALGAVSDAADGDNGKLTTLLGSVEAVGAAQILTGTGAEKFAAELDRQATAAGSVDDAFAVMSEGVGRQMDVVKVRLENAAIAFGTILLPAVAAIATAVADFALLLANNLVPVLQSMRPYIDEAGEALSKVAGFVRENSEVFSIVAAVIATVFIPHFVAMATAATINAAKTVAAWVTTQLAAIKAAAIHSAQVVKMVAKWVAAAVGATVNAAVIVAGWVATGVAAVAAGVVHAAQVTAQVAKWVVLATAGATVNAAKVVAGWVVTSAGAIAAGVVHAAQVAAQVAKWVFLGAQALIHAGRIAAAWLIAIGPIGLVIAAVIGVVALIVANFDKIKAVIGSAWEWVKGKTREAWAALRGAVAEGVIAVVGFVTDLKARIKSATSGFPTMLLNAGRELMAGLGRGIQEKIDAVVGKVKKAAQKIKDLLPGSPVKTGPLTSWNNGGAGKRLMGLLADGISAGAPEVDAAMRSAVEGAARVPDAQAVVGVGVRAGSAAQGHTAPGSATAAPGASVMDALLAEITALRADVQRLPREHRMLLRMGV